MGSNEAGPLTSSGPNELWTDPSALSRTDLRHGNENNEQGGGLDPVQQCPDATPGPGTAKDTAPGKGGMCWDRER